MPRWTIRFSAAGGRQFQKLPKSEKVRLLGYLQNRVAEMDMLRSAARKLASEAGDLWRYRVGNYRIVVEFSETGLVIVVVSVAHRREVHR
jgi:mRNA interferase RelE/StbE